jgi:hypothetical protein
MAHNKRNLTQTKCGDYVRRTYFVPWMSLDLRELELCVIGIHTLDFFPRWSTQNLDNLHKLIHGTFSRE